MVSKKQRVDLIQLMVLLPPSRASFRKTIRTRASFNTTLTTIVSEETLIDVVNDKNIIQVSYDFFRFLGGVRIR